MSVPLIVKDAQYSFVPHVQSLIDVRDAALKLSESATPDKGDRTFSVDAEALHELRAALLTAHVNALNNQS